MLQTINQVPKQVLLEFYNLTKLQVQYLYDVLDSDIDILYRVLYNIKRPELIDKLIEELKYQNQLQGLVKSMTYGNLKELKNFLKQRVSYEKLISSLEKLNVEEEKQKLQALEVQERPIVQQDSKFLELPPYIHLLIMDFLDPYSLHTNRLVCLKMNEIFNNPQISDKFYQKFCKALFDQIEIKPIIISPFEKTRKYINENLHLYEQQLQLINDINQNPSQTIWNNWGNAQQQIINYQELRLQYQSHKDMYDQQLRLNYCGIYAMKEYYIKYGEAQFQQSSAPCYRVDFFRYIRFWRDGTFTMFISSKKLTKQEIIEYFQYPEIAIIPKQGTQKQMQIEECFLRGEYRIVIDEVHVIAARQSTTFSYIYKIKNYKNKHPGNVLLLQSGQMHTLGDNYRQDIVDNSKKKHFVYKHLEEFRQELHDELHGWKNVVY
ncbi:unnamed protein product [Paramecium primaurelia]|uniref:F-box domain-containing protein n=1 Tax=Paramecium primaurelia TaxID=5886 RepID=A0A8S1NDJ9_PARPR|nr:unnamed protein product [Paramecium primaurelia]